MKPVESFTEADFQFTIKKIQLLESSESLEADPVTAGSSGSWEHCLVGPECSKAESQTLTYEAMLSRLLSVWL